MTVLPFTALIIVLVTVLEISFSLNILASKAIGALGYVFSFLMFVFNPYFILWFPY